MRFVLQGEPILRRAADEFLPAVAEVAKTFGPSTSGSKLLASSATGKAFSAARLTKALDHGRPSSDSL